MTNQNPFSLSGFKAEWAIVDSEGSNPIRVSLMGEDAQMGQDVQTGHRYAAREVVAARFGVSANHLTTAPVFSEVAPTPSENLEHAMDLIQKYGALSARYARNNNDETLAELLASHDEIFTLFWSIYEVGKE